MEGAEGEEEEEGAEGAAEEEPESDEDAFDSEDSKEEASWTLIPQADNKRVVRRNSLLPRLIYAPLK